MNNKKNQTESADINHLLKQSNENSMKTYLLKLLRTFTSVVLLSLAGFPFLVIFIFFPYKGYKYSGVPGLLVVVGIQVVILSSLYLIVTRMQKR